MTKTIILACVGGLTTSMLVERINEVIHRDSRLLVVDPVLSKGLEFDVVVLVDPAEVGERSVGDLYVAMTRPTRRLRVVSRLTLPRGLEPRSGDR